MQPLPQKMLHDAKRLLGRLLLGHHAARRSLPQPPNFDAGDVFAHLREPTEVRRAWREGRPDAAWSGLIDHFSTRTPVLGFFSPTAVQGLVEAADDRFPAWRPRLLAKVQEDRQEGLSVYDRRAGPLSSGFDWREPVPECPDDRLYAARPHRLGFLARWALACHHDRSLIGELEGVLAGWMAAAALPGGHPGFKSSHVVVYHFIAVLLAWPFLASLTDDEGAAKLAALKRRALHILYEGSLFMRAVDGGGVANNHRLAERLADWLSAALLPEFEHVLTRGEAEASWLEELWRQTLDDGGSFEHSVHYQEHVCELAVIYLLLSRRNGWAIPEPSHERIERMLAFQLAMIGPALLPLPLGNTTEDPLLALGIVEGWQGGLLREVQRACFAPEAPAAPDEDPSREAAFWLLEGKLAEGKLAGGGEAEAEFQDFPESGISVCVDPERRARLIFRLGPSPAAPGIGGHSHGDILSLCMSVGDFMVLAPPGTGSYRFKAHAELPGHPNLRAHFASAACRSGLFLEGEEPYGPLKGDFRNWRLPCQVEARRHSASAAGLSWIEGRVIGEGPYVGQRRGVIHLWERGWLVYDEAPDIAGGQSVHIGWQFGAEVACNTTAQGNIEAEWPGAGSGLHMRACGAVEPSIITGGFEPFRGWVSPSYGRLLPAANLRFTVPVEVGTAAFFLSLVSLAEQELEQILSEEYGLGFRLTSPQVETLLLVSTDAKPATLRWEGIAFHGRLLCLRRDGSGTNVRALGLQRLSAPAWRLEMRASEPADFEVEVTARGTDWPRGPCHQVEVKAGS